MKRKILFWAAIAVCAVVFVFSLSKIIEGLSEYRQGTNTYNELREFAGVMKPTPPPSETDPADDPEEELVLDFDALLEINSQCVGWIYSEGTIISYPIAQASDNSYYLKHMFNGESNSAGCIFLDYRNAPDFSDFNSVIFGHNLKNGTMFRSLTGYKEQSYYDEHPVLQLLTPEKNYDICLFGGYIAKVTDDAWQLSFEDDAARAAWLQEILDRSTFQSDVVPEVTDHIVTLSTCSYEFTNARYVVFGVLREVVDEAQEAAQDGTPNETDGVQTEP